MDGVDTVENMQKLISVLDAETLEQLKISSAKSSLSQADKWLHAALGKRVFVKLVKLELKGEYDGHKTRWLALLTYVAPIGPATG